MSGKKRRACSRTSTDSGHRHSLHRISHACLAAGPLHGHAAKSQLVRPLDPKKPARHSLRIFAEIFDVVMITSSCHAAIKRVVSVWYLTSELCRCDRIFCVDSIVRGAAWYASAACQLDKAAVAAAQKRPPKPSVAVPTSCEGCRLDLLCRLCRTTHFLNSWHSGDPNDDQLSARHLH